MSGYESGEILEAAGVTVRYGTAVALADVSVSVARGQVYALLGRNGAGKSSLLRCALGQQKPSRGAVSLFGRPVWASRETAMTRTGVVPEDPDAPPEMSPRQLSSFCARLYPSWDAAAVEARLGRSGVPLATPFGRLSKGQKGLVQLALALGHRPDLLVLDDPTLGLDAVARAALLEEPVGELADRGTTVFLATHDLAGVEGIADRVGILKGGRLLLDEDLEALKLRFRRLRYGNEATDARVDGGELGRELEAFHAVRVRVRGWGVEAVVADYDDDAFARFAETEGVVDAEAEALTLEEIFLVLAGERAGGPR